MRDEIDSRLWNEHGHAFSESVANFLAAASQSLKRLHAIQFDAPWRGAGAPAPAGAPRLKLAGLAFSATLATIVVLLATSGAAAGVAAIA